MLREQRGASLLQDSRKAWRLRGHSSKMMGREAMQVDMREGVEGPEAKQNVDSCMDQFNPQTEDETKDVLSRWNGAYLELAEHVAAKKQKAQSAAIASTAAPGASSMSLFAGSSVESEEAALSAEFPG